MRKLYAEFTPFLVAFLLSLLLCGNLTAQEGRSLELKREFNIAPRAEDAPQSQDFIFLLKSHIKGITFNSSFGVPKSKFIIGGFYLLHLDPFEQYLEISLKDGSQFTIKIDKEMIDTKQVCYFFQGEEKPNNTPITDSANNRTNVIDSSKLAKKENESQGTLNAGMVLLAGGKFLMGDKNWGNAQPMHQVEVSPFYLDKTEVTVKEYRKFCLATGNEMPSDTDLVLIDDAPIVAVTWFEATAYAKWIGKRLPTEAEWEYAAKSDSIISGSTDSTNGNTIIYWDALNSNGKAHKVATSRPYKNGIYDLIGNVSEWCSDWYTVPFDTTTAINPRGAKTGEAKVTKGGSYDDTVDCSPSTRNFLKPNQGSYFVGFRCAKDVK